jgi:hypothetical protein
MLIYAEYTAPFPSLQPGLNLFQQNLLSFASVFWGPTEYMAGFSFIPGAMEGAFTKSFWQFLNERDFETALHRTANGGPSCCFLEHEAPEDRYFMFFSTNDQFTSFQNAST